MRLFDWHALRRNWMLAVCGLLVTVCLSGASVILFPSGYVTTSKIVLLPPISQNVSNNNSNSDAANPYLGLSGLQSMASVVSSAMTDDVTAKALKQAGVSQYSVEYDALSGAPILVAQVTEPSSEQAAQAIAVLDRQVPLAVAHLQDEVSISAGSFITARVVATPTAPARSAKNQLRIVVLVLVVGVVLTLLAVSVVDGWRNRRASHEFRGATEGRRTYTDPIRSDGPGRRDRLNEPALTRTGRTYSAPGERYR